MPAASGGSRDVLAGYDDVEAFKRDGASFGAIVGRVANRISGASFTLDGRRYRLEPNDPPHHLHGGSRGFASLPWRVESRGGGHVVFSQVSPDGAGGYPGTLSTQVRYELAAHGELTVTASATTDRTTPVNIVSHAYFRLSDESDVRAYELQIESDDLLSVDDRGIPDGRLVPVADGPFDFTVARPIGLGLSAPEVRPRGGYDHCFALRGGAVPEVRRVATLRSTVSGIAMEVLTDAPGLQLYTGNGMDGTIGKGGVVYGKHAAVCLECQGFPDAVNHPQFPTTLLQPGEQYLARTVYRFSVF